MTDTNPFWEFSIVFYSRENVAPCCLELQEMHQLDVNILLFCLWRAHCGELLQYEELHALDAQVCAWRRDVVRPLRQLRQQLREYPAVESTRELLKKAELESERVQQSHMWRWQQQRSRGDVEKPADCIAGNLACLARLLGVDERKFSRIDSLARIAFSP